MHLFTTYNEETKASIVEGFNRTLKTKMWKYFTHRETLTYVDVLSNSSVQLGKYPFLNIRLALLSRTLSPGENLHDFVGPFLPYSLLDTVAWLVHKGYLPNWTEELFTVVKCIETKPPVYLVKDDHGEILEGKFYVEELPRSTKSACHWWSIP
jgi:hypothetical protein